MMALLKLDAPVVHLEYEVSEVALQFLSPTAEVLSLRPGFMRAREINMY